MVELMFIHQILHTKIWIPRFIYKTTLYIVLEASKHSTLNYSGLNPQLGSKSQFPSAVGSTPRNSGK